MRKNKTNKKDNKRCCSVNGFSLLPLALQSRLFCLFRPSRLSHLPCLAVIIITTLISLAINSLYLNVNSTSADSKIVLSIPNPNINLDVLSISAAGNFKSSSNMAINVSTDYYAGYTLGISAKTSNGNSLVNQDDNTKTLTSINNLVSETNYKDDTYAITNSLNVPKKAGCFNSRVIQHNPDNPKYDPNTSVSRYRLILHNSPLSFSCSMVVRFLSLVEYQICG